MGELQEVTSSKPFVGKSKHIDENGLLSERIFGPQISYQCRCGKLKTRTLDRGKRCPSCGVLCDSNDLRLKTYAKISLPFGAIKPTKLRKLVQICGKKNKNLLDPIFADHSQSTTRYLGIQADGKKLLIFNDLEIENNWYKIPFRITGIYTFILVLKYLANILNLPIAKELFEKKYIMDYIKVLPPDIRPIIPVKDQPNKLRITKVNKKYESLINLNNINKSLICNLETEENNIIKQIHYKFKNLQLSEEIYDEGIIKYDEIASRYQYRVNETYESVFEDVCGKEGYIRSGILGKTIEFSGRTVIRCDPSLKPYQIGVSKKILYKLWFPYFNYYMTAIVGLDHETFFDQYSSKDTYRIDEFNDFLNWFIVDDKKLKRILFVNRQPTLWRHSAPAVEAIPIEDDDDNTIAFSPPMLEPLNADFDGDTVALYAVHDNDALKEVEEKAFLKNCVKYDQDDRFLSVIRHEALYGCYILTENKSCNEDHTIEIDELSELPESLDLLNNLDTCVHIKNINKKVSYGFAVLNKWCEFNDIIINQTIIKNKSNYVSDCIYKYFNEDNEKFYDVLTTLNQNLLFFISSTKHAPTANITEMMSVTDDFDDIMFRKIPDNNTLLGYHLNEALVSNCLQKYNKSNQLYKLFTSGSRFSLVQFARSCINIGYISDDSNNVVPFPINSNLMTGISEEQFFLSSPGTRKSISDKSKSTPESGFLERTLVMSLSVLEIEEDDCGTSDYLEIQILNDKHKNTLIDKYYKSSQLQLEFAVLTKEKAQELQVGQTIYIRSPITCATKNFRMCKKCFGERKFPTKYLGIVAGQNITERLTQLTMRTSNGALER